ncbi:MAG: Trk system potassium transporter TrkA [Planctomycetota bacterium]|nr:MAG: Trk system potassium transporter TrkA [Planctomycetota bacterium]
MHIVIIGIGEVGFYLAEVLAEKGHSVTVIDPSEASIRRAQETLDVQVIQGDATHPRVLDDAEVSACDLLLAVSDNDQVNLLSTLMGRRMGAKKAILRVKDREHYRSYGKFLKQNLLYEDMLSLEDLASEEIAKVVRRNQAIAVENFLDGHVTLRVVPVDDASPLKDLPLRDAAKGLKGTLVTAIRRQGATLIPDGGTVFAEGDRVYLLGKPGDVEKSEAWVGHHKGRARNIVVFGGSNVAFQATRLLERHSLKIKLLAPSHVADRFAELLDPRTSVLRVDGAEFKIFKEEHVGKADAFVAASESDETNLLCCMLATHLGCKRTLALVSRPDYNELYRVVGISAAISPRLLCSNAIVDHVQAGSLHQLAAFDGGEAKVCAARVGHGSTWCGKQLKFLDMPKGCVIGAIQRHQDGLPTVLIPKGDDVLYEDDNLILFLLSKVEKVVHERVSQKD